MSFLLDANVVSEWTKPRPNPGIIEWGCLIARHDARRGPIQAMDAMIAATAQVHALTLVTRNASDFSGVREIPTESLDVAQVPVVMTVTSAGRIWP